MSLNLLEKQMFDEFIHKLENDGQLPNSLVADIKKLHLTDKLATGDALKKLLEEFQPYETFPNEDKST
ncbi:hypothetical protein [Legionella maioricensis]|uniref:Uncharacterized protein n=1 Tax=Legionella maioricensis TaxID=2896528 RepID=A0A9X2D110_9GAMM|nr:hypothetical protein [Legionella maioricensis]MCL9684198.1 hypothetical protein [Legionella maioricensis]MCL9687064.1 hypothetical protein [Legionella maioricensis]